MGFGLGNGIGTSQISGNLYGNGLDGEYSGIGNGFGRCQMGGGFGGNNLMAGLGCFQLDLNNNMVISQNLTINQPAKIDLMELVEVCRKYTKPTLIAGAAFKYMFKDELARDEFSDGNWNVYGVAPNGKKE